MSYAARLRGIVGLWVWLCAPCVFAADLVPKAPPDAIGKMVAAGFERMSPSLYEKSYHSMTSFDVEVNGDSATAWSRWTWIVVGADGKPQPERAGHYEDTLVRERGQWKFKFRQAFTEIN